MPKQDDDMIYVALANDRYGLSYGADELAHEDAVMNCLRQLGGEIDKPVKFIVYRASKDWNLEAWSIVASSLTKLYELELPAKTINDYINAYEDIQSSAMIAEETNEPEEMKAP